MKRIGTLCIVVLMSCAIAGCGQKGGNAPSDSNSHITAEATITDDKKGSTEQTSEADSLEQSADAGIAWL